MLPHFCIESWLHHAHPFIAAAEKACLMHRSDCVRTIVEIEDFATVRWKWGCQPFSYPYSQNVTRSRKEIYATYLSKESIPASTFGNCKHPVPTRSFRFESCSTFHQLCIIAGSCPALRCSCRKRLVSRREAEGLVTNLWSPRFVAMQ